MSVLCAAVSSEQFAYGLLTMFVCLVSYLMYSAISLHNHLDRIEQRLNELEERKP